MLQNIKKANNQKEIMLKQSRVGPEFPSIKSLGPATLT